MRTGLQVPWLRLNAWSIQRLLSQQQLKVNFHIEFRFNPKSIWNQDFYFFNFDWLLSRHSNLCLIFYRVSFTALLCLLSTLPFHLFRPCHTSVAGARRTQQWGSFCGLWYFSGLMDLFTVLLLSSLTPPVCCMDFLSTEMPACVQHDKSDSTFLNLRLIQSCNKNAIPHTDHVQRIASSVLLCDIHILNMTRFHLL